MQFYRQVNRRPVLTNFFVKQFSVAFLVFGHCRPHIMKNIYLSVHNNGCFRKIPNKQKAKSISA